MIASLSAVRVDAQSPVRRIAAVACIGLTLIATSAIAQSTAPTETLKEPEIDQSGEIRQKIVHRLHPQVLVVPPWATGANAIPHTAPRTGSTGQMTPAIAYHGGPVMTGLNTVYVIWYGNWNQNNRSDTPAGKQIILDALYGLSQNVASPYTNYTGITTGALGAYTQGSNGQVTQVSSPTVYTYSDNYSQGRNLRDSNVLSVVKSAIAKGGSNWGSPSASAVYLVLTSSDVAETSGFCSRYCGWHTYTTSLDAIRTPVKYAFIGNANRCLNACAAQTTSPNANAGVDAMASVIAHELEEAVTDPLLNAWYDSNGAENGDKCAWTFGQSFHLTASGAYYNMTLPTAAGSRNYLLQRALARSDSKCYVDASTKAQ